jgi:hypothetical protein
MNNVLNRSDPHCAVCGNSPRAFARFCDGCGSLLIASLEAKVASELGAGDFTYFGYGATELVKLLIARAREDDLKSANRIATRLAAEISAISQPALELWPLLCQILLADVEGDTVGHGAALARYRDLAEALDARGHLVTVAKLSKAGAS